MSSPATSNSVVHDLLAAPQVQSAFRLFESQAMRITEEQIEICAIAAPPFGEKLRAEYLRKKFSESGLVETDIDEAGNCLALYGGAVWPRPVFNAYTSTPSFLQQPI